MPDIIKDIPKEEKSDSVANWMEHNVLNPALNAGPLAVYNIVADAAHLPECHLSVAEAKPYSASWFVQGLSGGAGAAVPFMLAGAGAGKAMRAADTALVGTKTGEMLSPVLTSRSAANIFGATAFGALQKPDADHTRFGNAVGMGLGIAAFEKGNMMSRNLSTMGKVAAYPMTGFVGGAVMSESSQFFSNGKLADTDHVLQSAVQGMALNSVMPLAGEGFKRISTRMSGEASTANSDIKLNSGIKGAPEGRINGIIDPEAGAAGMAPKVAFDGNADLLMLSKTYSDWVKENQPSYPTTEEFASLTPNQIVERGFYHPDATNLDQLKTFQDAKPRPLPDAKVVAAEVTKALSSMPMAKATGDLVLGEWNMEFLTGDKAAYFADTYKQVVPRHHLMFIEETNSEGLQKIAQDNGYNYEVSRDNSRGQAVGFLVHPRLKVLGTHSYDEVANVHNIPDLRPAFRIDLEDTATGEKFSAVTVHLKSMRGGEQQTSGVRTEQAQILANVLGPDFKGIIAGDWNTFLDKSHDLDPLLKAGFKIANPTDGTSTQSMGGRLDGFLFKGINGNLGNPTVRPFFKNPLITRGLSDHGLLSTQWSTQNQRFRFNFVPALVGFDQSRN